MPWLNPRSVSTQFLIIFIPLALMLGIAEYASYYYPQYVTDVGYAAMVVIFTPIGFIIINAYLNAPKYPHIEHSIFDSVTGIAYKIEDFFIDYFDPTEKVPDIWPAMKKTPFCKRCKEFKAEAQVNPSTMTCKTCAGPIEMKDKAYYVGGRWFYPYLVRTRLPVSFGSFEKADYHLFVLPSEWDDFMGFGRRPGGAYWNGEAVDHGTSTHIDSILAPFPMTYRDIKIPIYLSIVSRRSVQKITKSWKEDMIELARFIPQMSKLIEQEKAKIFPAKEIEQMIKDEFPVILADYGAKRKEEKK